MNTPLGDELLSVGTVAVALASIPARAGYAQFTIETAALRTRFTGSAPNATVGFPLPTGGVLAFQGDLSKLMFVSQSAATGVVQAFYFQGPGEVV